MNVEKKGKREIKIDSTGPLEERGGTLESKTKG